MDLSVVVYYELLQVRYLQAGPSAAQLLIIYPFIMDMIASVITETVIIVHTVCWGKNFPGGAQPYF